MLIIIGTRPEAIKLFSVIRASQAIPNFRTKVCVTHQHTDLLVPFLETFEISIDYALEKVSNSQSLSQKTATLLGEVEKVIKDCRPSLVIVQGDTLSSFVGALASHYSKIPVAHVEAGLRTEQLFSPWPEEAYRRMIDQLSTFFFVPTDTARKALLNEGFSSKQIYIVGNTSIDALEYYKKIPKPPHIKETLSILITMHRRENFGKPLRDVCLALKRLGKTFPQVKMNFFVHPNPQVKTTVEKTLKNAENIRLCSPSDHLSFIEMMKNASFILTDSGGIQEEAPYLGIPVLIARNSTERPEGIDAQTARLVGTCPKRIYSECALLLTDEKLRTSMSKVHHPYGSGDSGKRIIQALLERL